MPPKKEQKEEEAKPLIGRPGNNVSMGIVGMPNVGKSTLFNCLSNLNVPAENYPFCTIDPSVARVPVPDKRHDWLTQFHKPQKSIPASLTITDIAGLVKGAAEGKGLGNAFLSHIYAVDAIYHLVRAFTDKEIEHVEGDVDPVRDLEIISEELRLKDQARVDPLYDDLKRKIDQGREKSKEKKQELITLGKIKECLEAKKDIRSGEWDLADIELLNTLNLLSSKPIVFLVNISKKDYLRQANKWLQPISAWVQQRAPGAPIIPFSGVWQAEFTAVPEAEQEAWLKAQGVPNCLPKIIKAGYNCLQLIHYFTCGEDEVKAWTIRKGTKAPAAAGVIHSDFEKFFITADTMAFAVFKELGSEAAVKKAGKYRMEGKNYVVQDGDIMYFKHNAGGAGKKA